MNKHTLITVIVTLGLLIFCVQANSQSMDEEQDVQDAIASSDHVALVKYYEDQAKEMEAKVQEHKKLLAKYKNSSRYGKPAELLKVHCRRLINNYEQAVAESMSMADIHRQMVQESNN